MSELKMPEVNSVMIAGNLTKDPVFRQTTNKTPVVNFFIASNRKFRDANNQWQEDVCYVGIIAWNRLAESCMNLRKGSAVLIDGELQSHILRSDDGTTRTVVEIKARRIQFLHRKNLPVMDGHFDEDLSLIEDDAFNKLLTNEEIELLKPTPHAEQKS